jgi:CRISPR/Cas system-associated endonuclease/helicase Cas3
MWDNNKGQVIIPTGGGKTICMIEDAITNMELSKQGQTFVVVAPRILLAEQLCSEFLELIDTKNVHVMHVHSGETQHFSSTKSDQIHLFANVARTAKFSRQILKSIPFTLMNLTIPSLATSFLLLSFSLTMLIVAISLLRLRNTLLR